MAHRHAVPHVKEIAKFDLPSGSVRSVLLHQKVAAAGRAGAVLQVDVDLLARLLTGASQGMRHLLSPLPLGGARGLHEAEEEITGEHYSLLLTVTAYLHEAEEEIA